MITPMVEVADFSGRTGLWFRVEGQGPNLLLVSGLNGQARFWDAVRSRLAQEYRVLTFDQRGCGRSRPFSSLRANTTQDLAADMEGLREALGIDRWLVFGGSWGATLALVYARAHTDRVLGLVLRGVFACTRRELDWFYRDGANHLFPDLWERFAGRLSAHERGDVLNAYHERLSSAPIDRRRDDALAWAGWESALISMTAPADWASPNDRATGDCRRRTPSPVPCTCHGVLRG